ncbi:MAG: TIGR01244 family sulfur transferase [Pseudomonadota bacterium]|nr:TIGR01244 family sulfur transferase [Pseudomonadota bacterium]
MFRKLSDRVWASPQIGLAEVAVAAAQGIGLIINNRPEGESDDQTAGPEIEAAARAAGMGYVAIPVTHSGFSEPQVTAMAAALEDSDTSVLAYCRSGTRSTLLWALAQASQGADPAQLATHAARAGYDVSPIAPLLDMLAAKTRGTAG